MKPCTPRVRKAFSVSFPLTAMTSKSTKAPTKKESAGPHSGPVKVFRMDDVSASVFARERQVQGETRTFYSVTFSRSYKDAAGQRRYTKWFDVDDLGRVVAVAQQASEYIHSLSDEPDTPTQD